MIYHSDPTQRCSKKIRPSRKPRRMRLVPFQLFLPSNDGPDPGLAPGQHSVRIVGTALGKQSLPLSDFQLDRRACLPLGLICDISGKHVLGP